MTDQHSTETIAKARAGDPSAIATLYHQHQAGVYRYMLYRLSDHLAAEDLTSEVFLRMIRSLGSYNANGVPFQAWLYRIAHNLAVDYYRKNGRYKQVEFHENLVEKTGMDPARAVERRLTAENIH